MVVIIADRIILVVQAALGVALANDLGGLVQELSHHQQSSVRRGNPAC